MNVNEDLWVAVLLQAVIDNDLAWFKSKEENVGSYLWICESLDLDPHKTQQICAYARRKLKEQKKEQWIRRISPGMVATSQTQTHYNVTQTASLSTTLQQSMQEIQNEKTLIDQQESVLPWIPWCERMGTQLIQRKRAFKIASRITRVSANANEAHQPLQS